MNEVKDCERNYAKYFSKQSKESDRDLSWIWFLNKNCGEAQYNI
jgi:hypothetical protein